MKELYIAPELKVLCFAPVEKLMNLENGLDYGNLGVNLTPGKSETPQDGDAIITW